jgi:CO/xanthine dehydrogenase Mo-binding subunit
MTTDQETETVSRYQRIDARAKATGATHYVGDLSMPGLAHAAMARATVAHARIRSIDVSAASQVPGVIGVFTAAEISAGLYGRGVADTPILARDKVRFVGERVAAVVAETRQAAERAAALVEVDYDPLPAMTTIEEALAPDAVPIHHEPWTYLRAAARPSDSVNVVYHSEDGSAAEFEAAFAAAKFTVDRCYRTQGVHQGYLEPQACIAAYESPDSVRIWLTGKAPYAARRMIAECLGLEAAAVDVQSAPIGGDFGGKGGLQDAPVCVELSRLTGRPVKSVLRYFEDLTTTNPRHPAQFRVRLGCDSGGRLVAAAIGCQVNSGAYAGFTPAATGPRHVVEVPSYRVPVLWTEMTRVYTNTVPRGNMRAPGAPQGTFAFESALDELAAAAGIDPFEMRRRNLLRTGEADSVGRTWAEHRGIEVLDAALAATEPIAAPAGWCHGRGVAIYSRGNVTVVNASLRLTPVDGDRIRAETTLTETGTGNHTILRQLLSDQLGVPAANIEVTGVPTSELPNDLGAGASRVTTGLAVLADAAAKAWGNRLRDEPLTLHVDGPVEPQVGSYVAQIAQVAVDPATGQLRVLGICTAADVAGVVNPVTHQLQIDGGVVMGFGYACLEDLDESDGQVWAANMGDYKLPSARDVPPMTTVLVPGGIGVGTAKVKSVGETSTPAVAPAIANAVFNAVGVRIRELPVTAERIFAALKEQA